MSELLVFVFVLLSIVSIFAFGFRFFADWIEILSETYPDE